MSLGSVVKTQTGNIAPYYDAQRLHTSLHGATPSETAGEATGPPHANLNQLPRKSHCRGQYWLPVAALTKNPPYTPRLSPDNVFPVRILPNTLSGKSHVFSQCHWVSPRYN